LIDYFGVIEVDYMSVDTEGSELSALKTFPFHRLRPKLIGVEVLLGGGRSSRVQEDLTQFMGSQGYAVHRNYKFADDTADIFFVPKGQSPQFPPKSSMLPKQDEFLGLRRKCQESQMCLE
jgi:hypothetical protein